MDNKSLDKDLFILIGPDNFESEVTNEKRPVLLSFIHQDLEFEKHLEAMEGISKWYAGALKMCVLDAEFIGSLGEKLGVDGTPTFLVFEEGREKSRMLGQADKETLEVFLSQALPNFGDDHHKSEGFATH
jgi:thioredoxin 1